MSDKQDRKEADMECMKCKAQLLDGAAFCHICGKKQTATARKHKKRPNGTGTIVKLQGNRAKPWLAKKDGIYIGTYATKTEAERAVDRLTDTDIGERFNITFAGAYELWLPEHSRQITAGAVTSYRSAYKHCSALYDKKLRSIRHSDFQAVIIGMEQNGYSKSTCEKVLQLFGQLSAWGIREQVMETDHSRFVNIAATQKSEGKVFTPADIKAIKESTAPAADIALILLATGCRPVELFSAVRDNCGTDHFIGGSKTESGRNRVIAVAPLGIAAYHRLLEASEGKRRLIDGFAGNKTYPNFAKREFKDLMDAIGLEGYTPYDCRHTFITNATRSGIDPQILRRMVGHADLSTTDKYYTHLETSDILKAIASVDMESVAVGNKLSTRKKAVKKTG